MVAWALARGLRRSRAMFSTVHHIDRVGLVQPHLVITGADVAVVWASEAGIEIVRGGNRKQLREPSAGVRVAGSWAAWDAGGRLHQGMSYHPDGVQLEAGVLDGGDLRGDRVADQLWDYCYGSAFAMAIDPEGEPRLAWV